MIAQVAGRNPSSDDPDVDALLMQCSAVERRLAGMIARTIIERPMRIGAGLAPI
jgi:hypothetical protein